MPPLALARRVGLAVVVATAVSAGVTATPASAEVDFWLNNASPDSFGPTNAWTPDADGANPSSGIGYYQQNPGVLFFVGDGNDTNQSTGSYSYAIEDGLNSPGGVTVSADDPFIGASSLACTTWGTFINGDPIVCNVDGSGSIGWIAAYIEDPGPSYNSMSLGGSHTAHVRFASTLAPVDAKGVALVPVKSYSAEKSRFSVRERVTLKTKSGRQIARGVDVITSNTPGYLRIRISDEKVLKLVRSGHDIEVQANVKHASGGQGVSGSGDTLGTLTIEKASAHNRKLLKEHAAFAVAHATSK